MTNINAIDKGNVQRFLIQGYGQLERVILLFQITSSARARAFLGSWLDHCYGGDEDEPERGPVVHFALSWNGLSALLQDEGTLDPEEGPNQLELFFTNPDFGPAGSQIPKQSLGFVGESAPENWWSHEFDNSEIDLSVFGMFDNPAQKQAWLNHVRSTAEDFGLRELQLPDFDDAALSGAVPSDGILHFGYRDGISLHHIGNIDWEDTGETGKTNYREFFVGYPDNEYKTMPSHRGLWQDFAREGSYLGLTWISQDVAAFKQYLEDNASKVPPHATTEDPKEWIAAKLMGRWRDGSPLVIHPNHRAGLEQPENDFGYADDKLGLKCPLTSHIRIVNPRDQPMNSALRSILPNGPPKLIRRGFKYGSTLNEAEDDGIDRGLIGVFACARLNEQFYRVLRWIQKTDFSDDFRDVPSGPNAQDSMFGNRGKPQATTVAHIPVSENDTLELQLKDFIRFKGVVNLFAPSMSALRTLAVGR